MLAVQYGYGDRTSAPAHACGPASEQCARRKDQHSSPVAVAFLFGARRGMIVMMSVAARVEVISRSGPSWRCCSVSSATTLAGMVGGQLRDAEGRLA
jgi:hypothetical protein